MLCQNFNTVYLMHNYSLHFATYFMLQIEGFVHKIFISWGLPHKIGNPLDDWLDWSIPTNHEAGCLIQRFTQKLKIWH